VPLPGGAEPGRRHDLTFSLADARSGQPLRNLQPYLAAAGHIVIMRADGQTFTHEHADVRDSSGHPVFALPGTTFGPDLPVHVHFDTPGTYRLWGQFRLASGQVITAPFTLTVRLWENTLTPPASRCRSANMRSVSARTKLSALTWMLNPDLLTQTMQGPRTAVTSLSWQAAR